MIGRTFDDGNTSAGKRCSIESLSQAMGLDLPHGKCKRSRRTQTCRFDGATLDAINQKFQSPCC